MRERNQRNELPSATVKGSPGMSQIAVGGEEVAERIDVLAEIIFGVGADAAMIDFPGPHVLLEVLAGIEHGTRFEQRDLDAEVGEDFDGSAATGSGADHYYVVYFGCSLYLWHDSDLYSGPEFGL